MGGKNVVASMHRQMFPNLQQLRQENIGIDVEIIVGGRRFPAHSVVLMTGSGFFKKMFTSDVGEKPEKEISVAETVFEAKIFKLILDCIYTGKLRMKKNNAEALFRAADFLDIQPIKSHVEKFMSKDIVAENAIKLLVFAKKYNLDDLHYACERYLTVVKNVYLVARTEPFLNMNHEDFLLVIGIFQKTPLQKLQMYKFIMSWIKHSPRERHGHLLELLTNLPLESLPKTFLEKFVANEALIRRTHKFSELLLNATANSKDLEETVYIFVEKKAPTWMMLDAPKREWIVLPPMISERNRFRHAVMGPKIFICGGQVFIKKKHIIINKVEAFDTVSQEWKNLKPMKTGRIEHGMATHKGKLYVCGGFGQSMSSSPMSSSPLKEISSMERYCPVTDCWEEMASMQVARCGFQLVELNGFLYAINGNLDKNVPTNTVERYDPRLDAWTMVAPTKKAHGSSEAVIFKNKIFVSGGEILETYDPIKNKWSAYKYSRIGIDSYGGKLTAFQDKLYYFSWQTKLDKDDIENEGSDDDNDWFFDDEDRWRYHDDHANVYTFDGNRHFHYDFFQERIPRTPIFTKIAVVR